MEVASVPVRLTAWWMPERSPQRSWEVPENALQPRVVSLNLGVVREVL